MKCVSSTAESAMDDMLFGAAAGSYVENKRRVGRPCLAQETSRAIDHAQCRFILITGPPGVGKSAFVADLVCRHASWCRYFIRRDQFRPLGDPGVGSVL